MSTPIITFRYLNGAILEIEGNSRLTLQQKSIVHSQISVTMMDAFEYLILPIS